MGIPLHILDCREEAEEAGRISFAEFKKLYRQMKAEEKRKQFSPA